MVNFMNLTKDKVEEAVRYLVTALGGTGILGGALSDNEWTALAGAFGVIAGISWSVWKDHRDDKKDEKKSKKKES